MRGEFIAVWQETWASIWLPTAEQESAQNDIFCELYRTAAEAEAFRKKPTAEQLADLIDDPLQSLEAFKALTGADFAGERGAVAFLEAAFSVLEEQGGDTLSNHYFVLLQSFIEKFSLRYELRRPCILCPTLTGVFSGLIRELQSVTSRDSHLDSLMKDYEASIRDLRSDTSDTRIKTAIQKQINLIEAIGGIYPGINANTLGAICDQVGTWPHGKLKEALKSLYGFACDYPGIRHGGTAANAIRPIDVRDMVAVSVLLAGFAPYLSHQLNADDVYRGGTR